METWDVIEEESFEYNGEVSLCGGSGGSSQKIDYEYNRRMADLAERETTMSEKYFDAWNLSPRRLEEETAAANIGLLPLQTREERASIPLRGETERLGLKHQQELMESSGRFLRERAPVQTEFFKQALTGVNVGKRKEEAVAGVEHAYSQMMPQYEQSLGRRGLTARPGDLRKMLFDKAKAKAGESTHAGTTAEAENFERLNLATGFRQ